MKILGITGGIASGKSFIAEIVHQIYNLPVFNADEVNLHLYRDESVMTKIKKLFPEIFCQKLYGELDLKTYFKKYILSNPRYLYRLEDFMIPLLEQELKQFLQEARKAQYPLVIIDAPLIFEKSWDRFCDKIMVISAYKLIRKYRFRQRTGSTDMFEFFYHKQLTDREKFKYADYIIYNNISSKATLTKQLRQIIGQILSC